MKCLEIAYMGVGGDLFSEACALSCRVSCSFSVLWTLLQRVNRVNQTLKFRIVSVVPIGCKKIYTDC